MKNSIFLILAFVLTAGGLQSQWLQDFRLTNDTSSSETTGTITTSVAASGNFVHVVWRDRRDGNWELYYKRSTDGGLTWSADSRLTNNSAETFRSTIAVTGGFVHVFWHDDRDGNWEIYYKRSTDNGLSWGTDTRLTNNSGESAHVSAALSGSNIDISWTDRRNNSNYQIYYKRSADNGLSWGPDVQLTTNSYSVGSSVSHSGSVIHVSYQDDYPGNPEVYYKRSTDNGISWGNNTRLTIDGSNSETPSIVSFGTNAHIIWVDTRDGNREIYYKRSADEGLTWSADTRLTNNPGFTYLPTFCISGNILHIVWRDDRDGNNEIYYKRSVDAGLSWGNDIRLTNNSAVSYSPSVSASNSLTHVVWYDQRDGNYEVYYKKDPTGNINGLSNPSTEIPEEYSLEQNYPNPFNPTTNIEFSIPKSGHVNLTIYDVMGREVETLVNYELKAGTYKADWSASKYPSGVYFYRIAIHSDKLSSGEFVQTKKMILIK
jgi:hypothetical protein